MHFSFHFSPLAVLLWLLYGGVVLGAIVLATTALSGAIQQGPAAVGRALAFPSYVLGVCFVLIGTISSSFGERETHVVFDGLRVAAALVCAFLAGWVACRTTEDTWSMNVKLVAAIGLVPYAVIVFIGFIKDPGWGVAALIVGYVPLVMVGAQRYGAARVTQRNQSGRMES